MAGTTDRETRVLIDEFCSECKGEGSSYSPDWAEWNKQYGEAEKQAEQDIKTWVFSAIAIGGERAWIVDRIEAIMKERGIERPGGPEQPFCCECEGKGRRIRSVTLIEFGRLLVGVT